MARASGRATTIADELARPAIVSLLGSVLWIGGCSHAAMPDPKDAVRAYRAAVEAGDSRAIYGMLSERSRAALRPADVQKALTDERVELSLQAGQLQDPAATVHQSARVRYADGEDATLDFEGGAFRISSADGLPAGARTPAQALDQLRKALARRSYAGLMRILSPATRSALESDLRTLVDGLARPEGLDVQVSGDLAAVQIQGGHFVRLRRDGGVWKVEDFD